MCYACVALLVVLDGRAVRVVDETAMFTAKRKK